MPICPQAFLTGQPEVVCELRGSVTAMLEDFNVLDEVLEGLDSVECSDDSAAYLTAASKAINSAYERAMLAFAKKLTQPLSE